MQQVPPRRLRNQIHWNKVLHRSLGNGNCKRYGDQMDQQLEDSQDQFPKLPHRWRLKLKVYVSQFKNRLLFLLGSVKRYFFFAFAKGQKISKANYGFLDSPKKRTKLTILSKEDPQDSEFCPFFWELFCSSGGFTNILTLRIYEIEWCYLH